MKKLPLILTAVAGFCGASFAQVGPVPGCPGAFGPTKTILGKVKSDTTGSITVNTTLSRDTIYIMKGLVRVAAPAVLTVQDGSIIMGFPGPVDTSALIINRGAKMISQGTALKPVVMTSCKIQGARNRGDWGGLVILGRGVNNIGTNVQLEGGYSAFHGGADNEDNSGTYQYLRVEFAGIAFGPNQEINGITLGSVGAKTVFQFVEVSNSGDDSFEWFGGAVNGRNLIAFKGIDDDFDTDNGYSGINQFGISYRDANVADFSGSNSFESDNNSAGSTALPKTTAIFSNFTCFGPLLTATARANKFHKTGAFLRRNTEVDIYNSVFVGFAGDTAAVLGQGAECSGVYINGAAAATNASTGLIRYKKNTVVAYNANPTSSAFDNDATFNAKSWFATGAFANTFGNGAYAVISQYKAPLREDPLFALNTGSALLTGSSFAAGGVSALNADLPLGFVFGATPAARGFANVAYRGASAGTEWANDTWTEYNPNLFKYTAGQPTRKGQINEFLSANGVSDLNTIVISPNPAVDKTKISFLMDYTTTDATLSVLDMSGNPIFVQNANIFAGVNEVEVNTQNLNPGMYIVRLTANGTTAKTAKLNVVR